MTEPEPAAWPSSAVAGELTASLETYMRFFFLPLFLIASYKSAEHSYIWSRLAESKTLGLLTGKLTAAHGKGSFLLTDEGVKAVPKSSSGETLDLFGCCSATCVARRADRVQSVRASIFPSLILEDV